MPQWLLKTLPHQVDCGEVTINQSMKALLESMQWMKHCSEPMQWHAKLHCAIPLRCLDGRPQCGWFIRPTADARGTLPASSLLQSLFMQAVQAGTHLSSTMHLIHICVQDQGLFLATYTSHVICSCCFQLAAAATGDCTCTFAILFVHSKYGARNIPTASRVCCE